MNSFYQYPRDVLEIISVVLVSFLSLMLALAVLLPARDGHHQGITGFKTAHLLLSSIDIRSS